MLSTLVPYLTFTDLDGEPLDQGSVYYGVVNANPVTSPIAVFWDAAGTQPVAQPVKTSAGYPMRFGTPANVYAATAYSISVYDKKGRLVYTHPDSSQYNGLPTFVADLANNTDYTKGSSLVGYKLNATGSVGRTVNSRLSDRISVKDFGAVGDGVANDTVALQNAINAGQARGAEVLIERGTYLHTGLTISSSVSLKGEGADLTVLLMNNATNNHITVDTVLMVQISGIQFRQNVVASAGAAIFLDSSAGGTANQHSLIENCRFSENFHCIQTKSAYLWKVDRCTFNLFKNTGIWVQNDYNADAGDSVITRCEFAGEANVNTVGVRQINSGGLRIQNNKFIQGGYGYLMQLAHLSNTGVLIITGNSVEGLLVAGIQLTRVAGAVDQGFSDVIISNNEIVGSPTCVPINLVDTTPNWLEGITITGNLIDCLHNGLPNAGILINSANHFTITGNTILGTAGAGVGISIAAACGNGVIAGNAITNFTTPFVNLSTSTYSVKKVYQTVTAGITCNAAYGSLFSGSTTVNFPTGLFLQSPVVTATAVSGTTAVSAVIASVSGSSVNVAALAVTNGSVVTVHVRAEADY